MVWSNMFELNLETHLKGVDNVKFYCDEKDADANDEIAKVNTEHSVEKREEVYTRNRKVLHHQIRFFVNT